MIEKKIIKANARRQLIGNLGLLIPAVMLSEILGNLNLFSYLIATFNIEIPFLLSKSMDILGFLLGGVMMFGVSRITLGIIKEERVKISDLFSGLAIYLKVLFLYAILTVLTTIGFNFYILPGIIISLMFSQAFYILAEDEDESIIRCLKKSEKMMRGHKREFFQLIISFIGWVILCILTLGIALIWVEPYMEMSFANYYLKLKEEYTAENNNKEEKVKFL